MYAVVKTGGKQYTVKPGDVLAIEKLPVEVGEEVELMEKDGYHRFLGNDRVNARAKKELLWGTIPMLVLIAGIAALSFLF